jgi:hypothetical protein
VAGSSERMLGGMKMEGFSLKALLVGREEWVHLELVGVWMECQTASLCPAGLDSRQEEDQENGNLEKCMAVQFAGIQHISTIISAQ